MNKPDFFRPTNKFAWFPKIIEGVIQDGPYATQGGEAFILKQQWEDHAGKVEWRNIPCLNT